MIVKAYQFSKFLYSFAVLNFDYRLSDFESVTKDESP